MNNLFVPEDIEQKDLDEILELKDLSLGDYEESDFFLACKQDIFMLRKFPGKLKYGSPVKIASRDETIIDLCVNDGKLYDLTCRGNLYETILGKFIKTLHNPIKLCSHKDKLYAAYGRSMVMDVFTEKADNTLKKITSMTSFEGNILVSTDQHQIYNLGLDASVDYISNPILELAVNQDVLYYSLYHENLEMHMICDEPNDTIIMEGKYAPRGLCSHQGRLYYGCENLIIDAKTKSSIDCQDFFGNSSNCMPGKITALTSVPKIITQEEI